MEEEQGLVEEEGGAGRMERMRKQFSMHYTKRPQQRTSLEVLQRLLEHRGKDNESLAVVQVSAGEQLVRRPPQRIQMNRHMLLNECRKDTKPYDVQLWHKLRALPRSNSPNSADPSSHLARLHDAAQGPALARQQVHRSPRPACGQARAAMPAPLSACDPAPGLRRVRRRARRSRRGTARRRPTAPPHHSSTPRTTACPCNCGTCACC